MRARSSIDSAILAGAAEGALNRLGFHYLKHRGTHFKEFEVLSPCHFLVTIQDYARPQLSFLIGRRNKVETLVEVRRTLGERDPEPLLAKSIEDFRSAFGELLPAEPWRGLGFFGSKTERANWKETSRSD